MPVFFEEILGIFGILDGPGHISSISRRTALRLGGFIVGYIGNIFKDKVDSFLVDNVLHGFFDHCVEFVFRNGDLHWLPCIFR